MHGLDPALWIYRCLLMGTAQTAHTLTKGSRLTGFVHPAPLSSSLLPSHSPPSTHREAGMALRWGAAGSLLASSQEDVVDESSCEAKQLARRLGLAHRPNTALLYLIQKPKASCQEHLYLCNFVQRKVIAISVCHFHTSIPTASPFLLQTNIFDVIQTMGTSTLFQTRI